MQLFWSGEETYEELKHRVNKVASVGFWKHALLIGVIFMVGLVQLVQSLNGASSPLFTEFAFWILFGIVIGHGISTNIKLKIATDRIDELEVCLNELIDGDCSNKTDNS